MSDFDDEIRRDLEPGERLLWTGRQPPELRFDVREVGSVVACLALIATILTCWNAIFEGGPRFFAAYGVLIAALAVYNISFRYALELALRRNTKYALTTERMLIVLGFLERRTISMDLETLSDLTLSERPGGGGTIRFGQRSKLAAVRLWTWYAMEPLAEMLQIELADSAREVYEMIREAARKARDVRDDSDYDEPLRDLRDERIER
jgi:hypothetical protein